MHSYSTKCIPYSQKYLPGESFRQFCCLLSLTKFLFSKFFLLYLHRGYGNLYRIGDNNSAKCFSNYEGLAGLGDISSCTTLGCMCTCTSMYELVHDYIITLHVCTRGKVISLYVRCRRLPVSAQKLPDIEI